MVDDFHNYRDMHGTDAAGIRAAAENPRNDATALASLASELEQDESAVVEDIEGAIVEGTRTNPQQVTVIAADLARNGEFAVALLHEFAAAVETFDSSVEELNEDLRSQTMEVWRAEHNGTPTSDPLDDPRSYAEIKASIKAQLKTRYDDAMRLLDDAAEETAATFEQGPTEANVRNLVMSGFLPLALLSLWPDITLTDNQRRLALERGAETTARRTLADLQAAGLVGDDVDEDDRYFQWLVNAAEGDVDYRTITEIIRDHDITPSSFDVLDDLEEINDRDGKSFFLLPDDISGDDAERAVIMTYIFNAGTDYGSATDGTGTDNNFEETPYSSQEVQRIIDRQDANGWSYSMDVGFVHGNGGRLVTTPNGVMMGLGGNLVQGAFSLQGGTMWGDIFMVNIDDPDDEAQMLRDIVESGVRPYNDGDDPGGPGGSRDLDLDRLLHHEERHAQQWAEEGYASYIAQYGAAAAREFFTGKTNRFEEDAGLEDGGY